MNSITNILNNAIGQVELLQSLGMDIYLLTIFVVGFILCYCGVWLLGLAFWIIGALVGGTAGAVMANGDVASVFAAIVGTVAGALLFAMMFSLSIAILGGIVGLMIGAAFGNDIAMLLFTLGFAVLAVKMINPFLIVITSISGGLSLTYVLLNAKDYLTSDSLTIVNSFSGYVSRTFNILFQSGSKEAIDELTNDLMLLVLIIITGIAVQVYSFYVRPKRKYETEELEAEYG